MTDMLIQNQISNQQKYQPLQKIISLNVTPIITSVLVIGALIP